MKASEIAKILSAELRGDPAVEVNRIADLSSAASGDLSFTVSNTGLQTSASVVIVPANFAGESSATLLKVKDPKLAFARVAEIVSPRRMPSGVHPNALIAEPDLVDAGFVGAFASIGIGSRVGGGSIIHAGVRIGERVSIGEQVILHPNCVIYDDVVIGNSCVIHAGTVIGSDGFGYVKDEDGQHLQFPQRGRVLVGDNVDIGANCTIDRGSLGTTRIGSGTKIDNLVHIAHNVQIGERVLIAGQSGIAGSSVIEDDVVIAGQVGISDHVTIRSGAAIGAKSAVYPNKIVRKGLWAGNPARPIDRFLRDSAAGRQLEMVRNEIEILKRKMS